MNTRQVSDCLPLSINYAPVNGVIESRNTENLVVFLGCFVFSILIMMWFRSTSDWGFFFCLLKVKRSEVIDLHVRATEQLQVQQASFDQTY